MKIDWQSAPDGAEFYADGSFKKSKYKSTNSEIMSYSVDGYWFESMLSKHNCELSEDYEPRPQQWPSESRIDIIGTNGNTAEHYMEETLHQTAKVHYETQSEFAARLKAEIAAKSKTITTASDFLSEGLRILSERGKQYDPSGTKEMSFDNVAEAFNCLTNSRLKGSDVCLILALLKVVRQNANKGFHEDSAVDFVNYAALHSELVRGEKA